ncbi:MAG: hypothetical protein OXG44_20215, partial [Gammaproteobacteria bacterium]|nr:hypothetical protein [Gammaproteobacteria bacterium]
MQFFQHLLVALIAWVSIGVYGSFYVIRSLTSPRARRPTDEEIHKQTHSDVFGLPFDENPPNTPENRRIALDVTDGDDDSPPELFEDIEVPQSPKELRLAALVLGGLL